MARLELDRRLRELESAVLQMGEEAGASIGGAMQALTLQDADLAHAIIAGDDAIDRACAEIEELGACLISLHQPAVRDLRAVLSALAIAEDLERIADHAEGIAQLVLRLPHRPDDATLLMLNEMSALVRVQLRSALDAYRAADVPYARSVWADDNAVDTMHNQLVRSLIAAMGKEQDDLAIGTYLLWVAHNLERIADRASNVCERVVFIATGERMMKALAS